MELTPGQILAVEIVEFNQNGDYFTNTSGESFYCDIYKIRLPDNTIVDAQTCIKEQKSTAQFTTGKIVEIKVRTFTKKKYTLEWLRDPNQIAPLPVKTANMSAASNAIAHAIEFHKGEAKPPFAEFESFIIPTAEKIYNYIISKNQ